MYRLDRTYFKIKNQANEPKSYTYWKHKNVEERLRASYYLILCAYNYSLEQEPRMERGNFNIKKRSE